jgi:hypothetical protein
LPIGEREAVFSGTASFSFSQEDTECKAAPHLAPKGGRGQEHGASKAGWAKYLCPGLSANLHMVKPKLAEPQPSGLARDSGIHGTIEPVWWSTTNDVSVVESIPPQQPSVRGVPANGGPKWRRGRVRNQGITYKARASW